MASVQIIEKTIATLNGLLPDARKVDAGTTGTPGTRVRKGAQDVKALMTQLRDAVTAARKSDDA